MKINVVTYGRTLCLSLCSLLCIFSAFSVPAKADGLLDAFSQPSAISSVALSPSGTLVAFVTVEDLQRFVRVVDLGARSVVANIPADELDISGLLFVSDRYLTVRMFNAVRVLGVGKIPVTSRVRIDLEDLTIEPLLELGKRGVFRYQANISRIVGVSEDREFIYMSTYMESGTNNRPDYRLVRVPLSDPGDLQVYDRGLRHVVDFWMGSGGSVLVQETFNDATDVHRLWVNREGEWEVIYESEDAVRTKHFTSLTEDYSAILFTTTDSNGVLNRFALSLSDGEISPLFEGSEHHDIEATYSTIDGRDFGVLFGGLTPDYAFSNPELHRTMSQIVAQFEGQFVQFVDWSPESRKLIVMISGDEFANLYVMFEHGKAPEVLGYAQPGIDASHLSEISIEQFKARDGLVIPTIITAPRGISQHQLPLVVVPHGGPSANDSVRFDALNQYFAAKGAMVVQPQFRGSTGFGHAFWVAGHGEWGGMMQSDIIDVVDALVDEGRVDPDRVCILGGSYGGYAALMNAALYNDRYRCAVSINGVTDLRELFDYDREFWGRNSETVSYMELYMFNGDVSSDTLNQNSPVNLAENITADVLLVHAELDFRVPVRQSEDMLDELEDHDLSVEYLELEGDGHSIRMPSNYVTYFRRVAEFVADSLELED